MITTFVFDGALREPGNSVIESIPQFRSLAEIGEVSTVHTETGDHEISKYVPTVCLMTFTI